MSKTALSELMASLPCRKSEIQQLSNLYAHPDEPYPNSVYITGGPSCGKSTILLKILMKFNVKHAVINLIECYTASILFESILYKLARIKEPKCDNLMDFITYCRSNAINFDKSIIILDKAEKLRTMDSNLLPAFMRLKEVTGVEMSVVFLSELPLQKFYPRGSFLAPIIIHFPQYNKEELLEILSLDVDCARISISKHLDVDRDFYRTYIHVFLSVFYRNCRDLCELRYIAKKNFPNYCEPITKGEVLAGDSMALWRNICAHFKEQIQGIYLRTSCHNQTQTFGLELPFYAKFLLIAAYLASYNPAKDDKRFFVKHHGAKKKSVNHFKNKNKVSEQLNVLLGPKPFTFDRLLAIFYSVQQDKVGFNNNLLVQVSTLVELQLLSCLSDASTLDTPKYKCNVNYEFIQQIAKMVGFNIRKYLSDFAHL